MNNYEYIIASLPVLKRDGAGMPDAGKILSEIREQLDTKDAQTFDFFLKAWDGAGEEFYRKALSHHNAFVREYLLFDLHVRNEKVRYLNAALGREEGKDLVYVGQEDFFDGLEKVREILNGKDLLEREKGLDETMWNKAQELVAFDVFSLGVILSAVVKIKIIDRWLSLDEGTGRELFRKFVEELKNSKNI